MQFHSFVFRIKCDMKMSIATPAPVPDNAENLYAK